MNFTDIFSEGSRLKNPLKQEILRAEFFERRFDSIAKNHLRLWRTNQETLNDNRNFLLGIFPSWNFYDLYLLDRINNSAIKNEVIDVINLEVFTDLNEFKNIFGSTEIKQPPVLGILENGVLLKSLWNWEAKNFLIEKYSFIWSP